MFIPFGILSPKIAMFRFSLETVPALYDYPEVVVTDSCLNSIKFIEPSPRCCSKFGKLSFQYPGVKHLIYETCQTFVIKNDNN